jgi:translocator assembly and maintenance protein 41
MLVSPSFSSIVSCFPPCSLSFAYGSGVFPQLNSDFSSTSSSSLLDFIFVVDDSLSWHNSNLLLNSSHYSFVSSFGPSFLTRIQRFPPGLYFNPLVEVSGHKVKYGIIQMEDFIRDLSDWRDYYIAGRLQKPVKFIQTQGNQEVKKALNNNLLSAFAASLLLLSSGAPVSWSSLYEQICTLSYSGDIRMKFAENPNKVKNLVRGNFHNFHELYKQAREEIKKEIHFNENGQTAGDLISWNCDEAARSALLDRLPLSIQNELILSCRSIRSLSLEHQQRSLSSLLASRVRYSSSAQTFKGLFTAGIRRSLIYATKKISKAIK